jgi:REP element-mobilizing transposase RayT
MPQSLAQVYLHIIFSTKNRARFLQAKGLRDELYNYLGGTCRNLDSPYLIVGGAEDHVHILCRFSRTTTIAVLVRELKRESSKWIKAKDSQLHDFHWQEGYGVFSVSPERVEELRRYIANQEEHHKTESFQDEFRHVLKEYGVEYDERYVWD